MNLNWLRRWWQGRPVRKRPKPQNKRKRSNRRERYGPASWDELSRYGDPSE